MIYYHNPRCSKSRQGKELLESKGVDLKIKEYLKEGLSKSEIKDIVSKLDTDIINLIRVKENLFKELKLNKDNINKENIVSILSNNPSLLERPILLTDKKAAIGRPPEKLIEII